MTTMQQIAALRQRIRTERPLVHCITNHISINQCANGLLALGARPIMAEHKDEMEDITGASQALMLNLGNITTARMEAMAVAVQTAKANGVPYILDLVGVGASRMRLEFAYQLIEKETPAILKGNESEIRALCGLPHHAKGVDSGEESHAERAIEAAQLAAERFGSVILLSGKDDMITDGSRVSAVSNGHELMTYVTGTGCLQGAVAAGFLTMTDPFLAAVSGAVMLGLAGEDAAAAFKGHGSLSRFGDGMVDGLFSMTEERLMAGARIKNMIPGRNDHEI